MTPIYIGVCLIWEECLSICMGAVLNLESYFWTPCAKIFISSQHVMHVGRRILFKWITIRSNWGSMYEEHIAFFQFWEKNHEKYSKKIITSKSIKKNPLIG